ncbi:hypothetical protein Ssi03_27160 [Sphaerisporangium siamense]|uniref:Uncharacterized protein n=1 Tax=Sphaerisporangium siamense TaxID=795645 RepID=A0A7W7G8W8_9ACTN|nr:DUF6461 domain-containing protein [Sphaerisporangium siamense]MBB4699955.1 hypothetical protein [Sphaerisporangium siamense]GII84726.1 hypothetical protein Ssi03_27160 [Sphaerisporangium siamense]
MVVSANVGGDRYLGDVLKEGGWEVARRGDIQITDADVAWLAGGYELGDVWCLTFVWGLDETSALRRIGATEESIRPLTYRELMDEGLFPDTVLAGRLGGWTVLIERNGCRTAELDALLALSTATEAVSVLRNDYAADAFTYARDGKVVTTFDPRIPAWRYGSDPDRLVDAMRAVGFDPEYPRADQDDDGNVDRLTLDGALLLAVRLTRVVLTQEVLNGPLLGGFARRST